MASQYPAAFDGRRPAALVLDVDGVLTDNRIELDFNGRESKSFFVPDGAGLKWVQAAGVAVALISGRSSEATRHRARELEISEVSVGVTDKCAVLSGVLEKFGVPGADAIFVGDDLIDLAPMALVGLPVAVKDAHPLVIEHAVAVTRHRGGCGAVREVCEWILKARGDWAGIVERYRP